MFSGHLNSYQWMNVKSLKTKLLKVSGFLNAHELPTDEKIGLKRM